MSTPTFVGHSGRSITGIFAMDVQRNRINAWDENRSVSEGASVHAYMPKATAQPAEFRRDTQMQTSSWTK